MGGGAEHWVGVQEAILAGIVPVWFVEYEAYFGRDGIYDEPAGEYRDNAFRYALLSKAAVQLCKDRAFIPDVIHVHDWPTAPAAMFLKTWDRFMSPLSGTATVLTIHNIGYQGVYDREVFPYLGVGDELFNGDVIEDHGRVNLLKSGIFFADALTTVSPTHRLEMLDPDGGRGLAPYLVRRADDFTGILNGVDYDIWNPETDPALPANYSADDLAGKAVCKAELQRRMGLEVRADLPLFGIVSRFAAQKGIDLLQQALPSAISRMDMQFVALGSGDPDAESFFSWLAAALPGRVGSWIGYNEELAHLIEAGSDFFVMPSLYEPCGLNQMYSLRYGTLPIVRATGGLQDSIDNYNERTGAGTGFKFLLPTGPALRDTIGGAVSTWCDRPEHYAQLQQQAMAKRFSWADATREYLNVYQQAIARRADWV